MKPTTHHNEVRLVSPAFIVTLLFYILPTVSLYAVDTQAVALVEACRTGNMEGVQTALSAGVDVNVKDGRAFTPLMHALDTGNVEIARYLVGQGAAVDIMSSTYETVFTLALQSADAPTVEFLLNSGADWDREPWTNTYHALVWSQAPVLRLLDSRGAQLTRQTGNGRNALSVAAMFNNQSAVNYLLARGMDVNEPDPNRNYPLALAAFEGHLDMVKLLLAEGADPNAINNGPMNVKVNPPEAHTALVAAVRDNNLKVVNTLLEAGADPNLLDGLALRYSDVSGNGAIYQRLMDAGAKALPPYSFTKIETIQPNWVNDPTGYIRENPVDWTGLSIMNNPALVEVNEAATYAGPPVTLAVIPTREDLEPAEMLVTAELSGEPNLKLLERAQLQQAVNEWSLTRSGKTSVGQSIQTGNLLGADGLIILSQAGAAPQAKIVSTATGLVLRVLPGDKARPGQWAERIRYAVLDHAPLLNEGAEALTLVSIPLITSTRNDVQTVDESRTLSQALGIYLGAIDGVYLLDRRDMLQLAGEKMLSQDQRAFYSSGWLVDGSFDTVGGQLEITVRLRQRQDGAEKVLRATGKVDDPAAVMIALSQQAAEIFQNNTGAVKSRASDGGVYLSEAQRAFNMRQYESAQHAADAAWVLGNRSDKVLRLRVLTRMQRLRTLQELHEQKIGRLRGAAQVMGYRAPFLVEQIDSRELTATQCINLADDLLAIYQAATRRRDGFSHSELDVLMFYPEALKGMLMPLTALHSVSDEKSHQRALRHLREQLLKTTRTLLEIARENNYPHLYQSVFHTYLQALPYLIRDEDALFTELMERLDEASAMREPLSKHAAYMALDRIMRGRMNTIGGQAGTAWQRMAWRMAKGDNPDARLLGYDMVRDDAHDYQLRKRISVAMVPLVQDLLTRDDSLLGVIRYETEIAEDLEIKGLFRQYPKYAMGQWFPNPLDFNYGMPVKSHGIYRRIWMPPTKGGQPGMTFLPDYGAQMQALYLTRLRSLANSGSAAFPYQNMRAHLETYDLETLERMDTLAQQAKAKLNQRVAGQPQWESTASRFNSYVVRPIAEAAKTARENAASTGPSSFQLAPFQTPLINPDNPDKASGKFSVDGLLPIDTGVWVYDGSSGIFHYNINARTIDQSIFLPGDYSCGDGLEFINERYFAVWFTSKDRRPFVDIGVFDRQSETWRFFDPERIPEYQRPLPGYVGVRAIAIVEDQLFYSYLMHPDTSGMNRSEFLKDSRTTGGLAVIDMKTGKETLLASSNRTPAQSPLDNQMDYYIYALKGGEIMAEKHVYNPHTGEWRRKQRGDKVLETNASFPRFKTERYSVTHLKYDQSTQTLSMEADQYYRAHPLEATPLKLKLDLTSYENLNIPASYTRMRGNFERASGQPRFRVQDHPAGFILFDDLGFYFIPAAEVKPLLEETITFLNQ